MTGHGVLPAAQNHMSDRYWIKSAIKHPGALRASLGVKAGQTIPKRRLRLAARSKNKTTARRARLAMTLAGFHKK